MTLSLPCPRWLLAAFAGGQQAEKVNDAALKKGAMDAEAVGKGIKKTFSN